MSFDPRKHLTNLQGKPYLEVAYRLLWLSEDAPRFTIDPQIVAYDAEHAVVRAEVCLLADDGTVLRRAVGHGAAYKASLRGPIAGRWLEKAETAAIGRALSMVGYGAQYALEFDDAADDHLADSPVHPPAAAPTPTQNAPTRREAPLPPRAAARITAEEHISAPAADTRTEADAAAPSGTAPVRFEGGANERGQQFLRACRDRLSLGMTDITGLLGGTVKDYIRTQGVELEEVYRRLERKVLHREPIPGVNMAPAWPAAESPAVAALRDDLPKAERPA